MSSPGTILLVDDEQSVIDFISAGLKPDGYTLGQANSGLEALDRYVEIQPDLVLLDVSMPGLSGLDTCRRLIAIHGDACAPIIFFTSKITPNDIAEGFDAGSADYVAKPSAMNEIRARLRTHLQNHRLARQQKLLAEQLHRANVAKNRFIGMAAHDMRNPLVSIRGFAEFLTDGTMGPMPTRQLALVSIIHGTSNLMLKTLNELLDVASIEAGQLRLQRAPQNLTELIAKSVSQSAISARKKRAKIVLAPPPDGVIALLDADKVRQVIDILLNNATRFSPVGGLITVTLEASQSANLCCFAVQDQGPGIAETDREKLFKQVAGLGADPQAREKNAGVGLVICRNIVEAHGGGITAENLPERGCEFSVTLPLDVPQSPEVN